MRIKLGVITLALVGALMGAQVAKADAFVTPTIGATSIATCDGTSQVTVTIVGNQAFSATGLNYAAQPAAGWMVVAASATAGTTTKTSTSVNWTLPTLSKTTVVINYTLLHIGFTDGAAIPIQAIAMLQMQEPTGPFAQSFAGTTVSVSGCNTAPQANAGPDQTKFLNGSTTTPVTLDGSGSTDDGQLQPLSYTWTENGSTVATGVQPTISLGLGVHTITLTIFDGQYSATDGVVVTISDITPPVITPHVSGTIGSNGWYTSDVTVTWTVTDPESAIAASTGCGTTVHTTDTAGVTYTCSATSSGGTSSASTSFKRDATAPTIVFTGNAGSYTVDQQIVIDCAATDSPAGVASSTCTNLNVPASNYPAGVNIITATATDNAGNKATVTTSFTIVVTYQSLCNLSIRFAGASLGKQLCDKLFAAQKCDAKKKAQAILEYQKLVSCNVPKCITAAQAAILIAYSKAL